MTALLVTLLNSERPIDSISFVLNNGQNLWDVLYKVPCALSGLFEESMLCQTCLANMLLRLPAGLFVRV